MHAIWCQNSEFFLSTLNRIDAACLHDSNQSSVTNLTMGAISCNEVEKVSTIVDWSSLVIETETENDGVETHFYLLSCTHLDHVEFTMCM